MQVPKIFFHLYIKTTEGYRLHHNAGVNQKRDLEYRKQGIQYTWIAFSFW